MLSESSDITDILAKNIFPILYILDIVIFTENLINGSFSLWFVS